MSIQSVIKHEISLMGISLVNTFLFFVPPLIWNLALWQGLPMGYFPGAAPPWVVISENVFRYSAMAYSLALPVKTGHNLFLPGLAVYIAGMMAYFADWLILSYLPDSAAAQSTILRFGPEFLPIVWLGGMSLMARSPFLMVLSTLFVGLHVTEFALRYRP